MIRRGAIAWIVAAALAGCASKAKRPPAAVPANESEATPATAPAPRGAPDKDAAAPASPAPERADPCEGGE